MRKIPVAFFFALAIWIAFALLYAIGARDHVSVLSGTPVPGVPLAIAAPLGALYVLAWLGAVLLAPILAIGGALRALVDR